MSCKTKYDDNQWTYVLNTQIHEKNEHALVLEKYMF